MLVSQMFPSKTLDANDLRAFNPGVTPITIEKIDFKTVEASDFGEAGIVYYVKAREFKKPFKLNQSKAHTIADVLGSDDTDHWIGRRIGIMYGTVSVPTGNGQKRKFPVIDIDIQPIPDALPGPNLPPNADITGFAMNARQSLPGQNMGGRVVGVLQAAAAKYTGESAKGIGPNNAAKFKAALAEQGATMDDVLAWFKSQDQMAFEGCFGKELQDWPKGAAVAMSRFLREYGSKPADGAQAGAGGLPGPAQVTEYTNDDIPF